MAKTKQQKQDLINAVTQKLEKAHSVVFSDYQGLTMKQLSDLRDALRKEDAEFNITKNTLLGLSMKEAGFTPKDDVLKSGPTATLFTYGDEITPIKTLVKALKEASVGTIKAGFLDHEYLSKEEVDKLASLPGKAELQAKVVGTISSPLYGMVNVLQGNLRNLVYALNAIKDKKGAA